MRPPTWCPSCNAEVEPDQDFCMECGEPIAQARSVGEVAATPPPPVARPAQPTAPPAAPPATVPATAARTATASVAKPVRRRRDEEPEPVRCPGCGVRTTRARCPGCGTKLRDEDE